AKARPVVKITENNGGRLRLCRLAGAVYSGRRQYPRKCCRVLLFAGTGSGEKNENQYHSKAIIF
ncbi:MAG: hypothetical protein OIF35_03745, partial [Cellvibrionaceae bacterium]|nr:hypothetical protein [Cellvibrionaceae bacterium]